MSEQCGHVLDVVQDRNGICSGRLGPSYPQYPLPELSEAYARAQEIACNPYRRSGFTALESAVIFKCDVESQLSRLADKTRQVLQLTGEGFTNREIGKLVGVHEREVRRILARFYEDGPPISARAGDKEIRAEIRQERGRARCARVQKIYAQA